MRRLLQKTDQKRQNFSPRLLLVGVWCVLARLHFAAAAIAIGEGGDSPAKFSALILSWELFTQMQIRNSLGSRTGGGGGGKEIVCLFFVHYFLSSRKSQRKD